MDKEEAVNTQTKILQEAIKVLGNRGIDHGRFTETYKQAAVLWGGYLSKRGYHLLIEASDVLFMLALMKIARANCGNVQQIEHYIDAAGYVALAGAASMTQPQNG